MSLRSLLALSKSTDPPLVASLKNKYLSQAGAMHLRGVKTLRNNDTLDVLQWRYRGFGQKCTISDFYLALITLIHCPRLEEP